MIIKWEIRETDDPTTPVDEPNDDGTDIVVVSTSGNFYRHYCTKCPNGSVAPELTKFNVKAFPNPTRTSVSHWYLENATNEKVQIVVYDALGRQVKMFEKAKRQYSNSLWYGSESGVYVVEVRQGDNRKTLKLVKQ